MLWVPERRGYHHTSPTEGNLVSKIELYPTTLGWHLVGSGSWACETFLKAGVVPMGGLCFQPELMHLAWQVP